MPTGPIKSNAGTGCASLGPIILRSGVLIADQMPDPAESSISLDRGHTEYTEHYTNQPRVPERKSLVGRVVIIFAEILLSSCS